MTKRFGNSRLKLKSNTDGTRLIRIGVLPDKQDTCLICGKSPSVLYYYAVEGQTSLEGYDKILFCNMRCRAKYRGAS